MDVVEMCPFCHIAVRATDFFCFNCGKNLHPKPLSTGLATQALLYLGSIVLAPMGIIWGIKYLRQSEGPSKAVGLISIILSCVTVIIVMQLVGNLIGGVNSQLNNSTDILQGF